MNQTVASDPVAEQPMRRLTRDGTEYVLLGTAHVSRASAEAVTALIANEPFDAVAVELCGPRAAALMNPDAVAQMDLFTVLRQGRAGHVATGLALGSFQRRLAKQFGIEPGAEMRAAIDGAQARALPFWLIDRDVGTTLRRSRAAVGFWERLKLTAGLIASVLDDSEVDEASIERLKQGDVLSGTFLEFARASPALYEALITERDRYMAARLREEAARTQPKRVLAVVGAGHLDGLERHLRDEQASPEQVIAPNRVDPPPSRFMHWFGIALLASIVGLIAWGFTRSGSVGLDVLAIWVLTTGVMGALGATLAGAHPVSIVGAFVASPITPLHPALASGMISGALELWRRKPRIGDFQTLRDDLVHLKGWWRNRVAHVFLVFFLTNLGTALGVWLAGFRMAAALAG
jgi:pheromone shutdown-related protein TraB